MNKTNITEFDSQRRAATFRYLVDFVLDLYKFRYVLINLVSTALQARYRRSALGFLWSLLNPLFTMVILSAVFSTIYKLPFLEFGLYIMSGLLPWTLISNGLIGGAVSYINAEGYLKKVYLPKQIFPVSVLGVELVNFLLSLLSLLVIAIIVGARPVFAWIYIIPVLLLLALFLFGLMLVFSVITVYFRDFSHILQIALTGLFYLTPIVYPLSFASDSPLKNVIALNPFFYFIELFHQVLADSVVPSNILWLNCILLTFVSLGIGIVSFFKKENDIIYRL